VKRFGGEAVWPGHILIRQRGRKVWPGDGVKMGRDHTIYSVCTGWVHFKYNKFKKHQVVSVKDVNPNTPPKALIAATEQ
jgi:large subunit ribosomal protein L27